MATYLPDTNVLIGFGRDAAIENKLNAAVGDGSTFVLAPSTLEELSRGVVNGGSRHFENDKRVFRWTQSHRWSVLDLPVPFVGDIVHSPIRNGRVVPEHYHQLIDMISASADYDEFVRRKNEIGSVWTDIHRTKVIHDGVLDVEFAAFQKIAQEPKPVDVAARMIRRFSTDSFRPDLSSFRDQFSAAIEYAESTIAKVRAGAKLRQNDPGVFGDFQLFFYLANPQIHLLTREDFSNEIRRSPQRARIVLLDSLR
jgi:hypothetical protein